MTDKIFTHCPYIPDEFNPETDKELTKDAFDSYKLYCLHMFRVHRYLTDLWGDRWEEAPNTGE